MRIAIFVFSLGLLWPSSSSAAPTVARILPPPGSTNHALTSVEVLFTDVVTNVDASDLLINGVPAADLTFGIPGQFLFEFLQPATGTVQVAWATNHGITDLEMPPQPFAGGSWTYVLDPNAPTDALLLNEVMAENDRTLNDEDGDSEDWLEIHNPGAFEVDIGGWFLTDEAGRLDKWQFPQGKTIPANGYLVVFASNKDRTNLLGRLHTNFQLDNDGEYLALVDRNTNVVSEFVPTYPALAADVSYGRIAGDPTSKGFFTRPTPGAPNQSGGPGFSPEVTFSHPSGTFVQNQTFALTLSTPLSNAVIYYAFGTNVPGTNTTVYASPLQINNTTMMRARAFVPGLLPGPITTRTYIALANVTNVVNFNSHLPILILHNYGQGALSTDKSDRYVIAQAFEPEFGRSSMTNAPALAEFGRFHLRGSSTVGYAKGSFFLELQDEFRNDKEVPLLGLPEESDWVLYAPNNFEPALFHNPLAFQLARDLDEYASRTRFVEVYLKDDSGTPGPITAADYNGVYVLEEKIKRDNNRVDIAPLERENVTEPWISGGYMWSIDRSAPGETQISAGGGTLNWIEPNAVEMTNAARLPQRIYATNYLNTFRDVLNNNTTWTNPVTGYAAYIDVDSWIRRHIHEVVTHNIDALRLSGYFFKDRGKKIEYGPAWDYDRTQGSTDGRDFNPRTFRSRISDFGTDYFNFSPWWNRLFRSPDFWQRWIDNYQEYREGPFSMANVSARIEMFAAEIRPAHAREVARWNILPRIGTVNPDGTFPYNFGTVRDYENEVRWKHHWYSNRLDFIDGNFLARPSLSAPAGEVTNGYTVTLSPAAKAGSSVFYTLDGTDPRLPSGGVLPTAFSNNGPVQLVITNNVRLFARSWNPTHSNLTGANNPPISSPWSGVRDATFYTQVPSLRITEIMYHPQDPFPSAYTNDVNFEYIEVKNIGGTPLNLNRFTLRGGVDFDFPNITLDAGQSGVIVANQDQFIARYGSGQLIIGQYAGDYYGEKTNVLDNAGERLILRGAAREPILDFEYDDDWYPITDGFGFSLVVVNESAPTTNWVLKSHWRPSGVVDGTPGAVDPGQPNFPFVVVNEVLTHTDPAPPYDSIELRNLSANAADISGWFLTDEFQEPRKFRIPDGTTISADGYVVFDETQFNTGVFPFSLSSLGDEVYLFSGDPVTETLTGYYQGFDFGPAQNGRTFGRHIISTGTDQFPPQVAPTLGGPNAGPLIGPIVISEIHYHPPDFRINEYAADNSVDEYIELQNTSSTNVPLYHPDYPANTWQLDDAVDFVFPQGVVLPPGGHLLVVNFDPANTAQLADFRARNYVPANVPIYGPYGGKLDNSGEAVELHRPDRPEPAGPPNFGLVPYLLVERVRYSDTAPWPEAADGLGPTLQRISGTAYGNDPASWVAAGGSPGAEYAGGTVPVITEQPTNTSVLFSYNATFSVQAQGSGLRYQWLFKGGAISGATNVMLTVSYVEPPVAGEYKVVVLGSGGSVVSSNAILTVLTNSAVILAQPQNTAVVLTNTATLRATISASEPVAYQWFFNGEEIPGATATNYTIPSVRLEDAGVYHLRITDSIASIFTRPAVLTVTVVPWFVQLPQSVYVPSNSSATVSVTVTNNATLPITYRWRRIGGSSVTNRDVYSTTDFFTVTNVTVSNRYDVIVFNQARPTGLQSTPPFFIAPIPDADADGMPDSWEQEYGFNTADPLDAGGDQDGDGMTNLAEYTAGTDPLDDQSYLFIELVDASGGPASALLRFMAVSNRTYSVQYRNALNSGQWSAIRHVNASPTNRVVEVTDQSPDAASRFYQLVTPKQ